MRSTNLKLKPSARDKRRYLLVSSKSSKAVEDSLLEYIGVLGFAKSAYMFVKKGKDGFVIGSCLRESLNDVRSALSMKGILIKKVSGTLKGLGA